MVPTHVSRYRVLATLGTGGTGEVYLAEDPSLGRRVALKVLHGGAADHEARRRLVHEARAAAQLDHPFICKVYEAGEHDGVPFLAMEYIEGRTLRDRLREGPLSDGEVLHVARELAEALEFAHRRGIVHRDLKPANVMLAADGHVRVMDFGIARRMAPPTAPDAATAAAETISAPGEIAGTLAYMSPEQVRGEPVDARADIFAFGVLLYELVTGRQPFAHGTSLATVYAILHESPPPLDVTADAAAQLEPVVARCLEKSRDRRYASFAEVRAALQASTASLTATARPPGRAGSRRLLAAALVLLPLLGVVWWAAPLPFLSPQPALAFKEREWIVVTDFCRCLQRLAGLRPSVQRILLTCGGP